MIANISGDLSGGLFSWIASVAGAVAVWASQKAQEPEFQDLKARIRKPGKWRLRHPVQAWRRLREGVD